MSAKLALQLQALEREVETLRKALAELCSAVEELERLITAPQQTPAKRKVATG